MKVLGIDPGSAVVGYGLVEDGRGTPRLLECGVIRTGTGESLPARLRIISDGITELIDRHHPDVLAIEGIFYSRYARATMVLGHARGVILLCAEIAGVIIAEYPPAVVKKTVVGRGGAMKAQVGYMCAQLLRLKTPPEPADAADGVALALTHLLRRRDPTPRLARSNGR
ncbi:MAG: crossover junction endodeoxyribonuclease RuvC [Gemmatimonadota bacterium]